MDLDFEVIPWAEKCASCDRDEWVLEKLQWEERFYMPSLGNQDRQYDILTLRSKFFFPSLCSSHQYLLSSYYVPTLSWLHRDSVEASEIIGKGRETDDNQGINKCMKRLQEEPLTQELSGKSSRRKGYPSWVL